MTKDFPVTEEQVKAWAEWFKPDAECARANTPRSCPLANAARRSGHEISVLSRTWRDEGENVYELSERWQRFVREIDTSFSVWVTAGEVLKALEATKS